MRMRHSHPTHHFFFDRSGARSRGSLGGRGGTSPPSRRRPNAVAIDDDDIGGVVTGPNGPEAGVWVIAETTELPTKFAKMVVTDDRGAT